MIKKKKKRNCGLEMLTSGMHTRVFIIQSKLFINMFNSTNIFWAPTVYEGLCWSQRDSRVNSKERKSYWADGEGEVMGTGSSRTNP